jgi:O-methyltransferase involved in polyketide biosynthesis
MLGNVLEIADAGDFEAVLSLGIGLRTQAGLRAYRLEGPSRLVIDLAH